MTPELHQHASFPWILYTLLGIAILIFYFWIRDRSNPPRP
jgi:hypothetical protein